MSRILNVPGLAAALWLLTLSPAPARGQAPAPAGPAPAKPPAAKPSPQPPTPAARTAQFDRLAKDASAAREAGRVDEALDLYQKAVTARPAWDEGHWYIGTLYYGMDRYREARDSFRRTLALQEKKAPGEPAGTGRVYAMKGLCEFQLKDYEASLADLLKAKDVGVDSQDLMSSVRYHLAIIMTRQEQYEYALLNLLPFAQRGNDSPTVIEAFGMATLRMPLLPSELPADRREMVLLAGRGSYYQAARLSGPARPAFEELVRRYPDSPNVQYAYGVFLLGDDPDKAIEAFKKELKLSPAHNWSMLQIAFEYIKRSDWQAARPWAEQAVATAPGDFAGRRALGQVLFELGETAAAIEHLERGIKLAPDSPSLHFVLARAYQKAGRAEDAEREREEFRKLQQLNRSQQYGEQAVGGIVEKDRSNPQ
jgi:tetratricopeptide (TPR) repeat protein